MKSLLVLFFFLNLTVYVFAGTPTATNTGSGSGSGTVSGTVSGTGSGSGSGTASGSGSGTASGSGSGTGSGSQSGSGTASGSGSGTASGSSSSSNSGSVSVTVTVTGSVSVSNTGTPSGSGSPTQSAPLGNAPINVINICQNARLFLCIRWDDPTGIDYDQFRVYVTDSSTGITTQYSTTNNIQQYKVLNLTPGTTYDVTISGLITGVGVWSANSTNAVFTTGPADPKYDPSLDITSFACSYARINSRGSITCTWNSAIDDANLQQINFKVRCTSANREPLRIRKNLFGTKAHATSVLFKINRDSGKCRIKAHTRYARPGNLFVVDVQITA